MSGLNVDLREYFRSLIGMFSFCPLLSERRLPNFGTDNGFVSMSDPTQQHIQKTNSASTLGQDGKGRLSVRQNSAAEAATTAKRKPSESGAYSIPVFELFPSRIKALRNEQRLSKNGQPTLVRSTDSSTEAQQLICRGESIFDEERL